LLNASTRSQISEGSGALIGGFVIAGTGTQGLLIRAVGPSLVEFGIGAPLARPVLTVYDAAGRVVAANAGWAASPDQSRIVAAAKTVGAFALPETSLDSAVVIRLPPGSYTAVVTGAPAGIGLLEMYDTDRWPIISNTQFTNLSCRGMVGTGQASLIAGLGLASRNPRLIRAVGPGLRAFGIEGVLADPRIDLVRPQVAIGGGLYTNQRYAPAMTVATNDDWHVPLPPATDDPANSIASLGSVAELMTATQKVGAFPLAGGSRDAALDVTLNSAVTIQVTGADGGSGIALVEVYEVGSR
jgi:hypothetical protein